MLSSNQYAIGAVSIASGVASIPESWRSVTMCFVPHWKPSSTPRLSYHNSLHKSWEISTWHRFVRWNSLQVTSRSNDINISRWLQSFISKAYNTWADFLSIILEISKPKNVSYPLIWLSFPIILFDIILTAWTDFHLTGNKQLFL